MNLLPNNMEGLKTGNRPDACLLSPQMHLDLPSNYLLYIFLLFLLFFYTYPALNTQNYPNLKTLDHTITAYCNNNMPLVLIHYHLISSFPLLLKLNDHAYCKPMSPALFFPNNSIIYVYFLYNSPSPLQISSTLQLTLLAFQLAVSKN